MKSNASGIEKGILAVIGLVALAAGIVALVGMAAQIVLFVVAGITIITGSVSFCPQRKLFGINT